MRNSFGQIIKLHQIEHFFHQITILESLLLCFTVSFTMTEGPETAGREKYIREQVL